MNTKEKILKYLSDKESVSGTDLSEFLGISRQAINKHLKKLIQAGKIVKTGVTKGAVYSIASPEHRVAPKKQWKKKYSLSGLEEDKVFNEAAIFLNLKKRLNKNTFSIFQYAFTEMVNNAIDHSKSRKCSIEVVIDQYEITFKVRDFGIGIFYSIFNKYNLVDEYAAIGELIKGKTTTMREKHTGEGIFFTSKLADVVFFRSHKTNLIFNNLIEDVLVEEKRFLNGSEVTFRVGRKSKKKLADVFSQYAPEEYNYEFNKTRVVVKLFKRDFISRSEAKRLLAGLEKFKEIVLDFKGVKSIGQGFADEIFRVFKNEYPHITIETENLSPSLKSIIDHVIDNNNIAGLTIS